MKPLHPMPTHCPVTGEPLEITRLEGPNSHIILEGRFKPNEFALLSGEQLDFLRIFLKLRGNLKEVERFLGISYPTVRLRFEQLLQHLSYESVEESQAKNPQSELTRQQILSALEKGELSAEEAAKQLRSVKKGR
ncbi:MAG: DUF2089 domain-containing protein [Deinococcales bacterium]